MTNDQGFRIDKDHLIQGNAELLTLGPSSAFGWGVRNEETYTSLSAKKMGLLSLNASGIGHSIAQGSRVWDLIKGKISPKYAIISYGVNDLDKFRFFDSDPINDKEFFNIEPHALKMDKAKLPSNFIIVLSLVTRQLSHTFKCDQLMKFPQRVEWHDYEKILQKIIIEMEQKNITPFIVNTPFYLAHPDQAFTDEKINKAYKEVSIFASKGQCKAAHEKLKIAKSLEPFSINQKVLELNKLLEKFAEKNQVKVIDAYSILVNKNAKENFYDPVHPSAKGHKLIADEITKLIQQKN